ncbi:MAG: hypothetical protein EA397_18150 [Deltaproteobacteria bacterium]|nr:MAG: hypothetical protein EA397_18150 [Deltaproteobacteria bacterium]
MRLHAQFGFLLLSACGADPIAGEPTRPPARVDTDSGIDTDSDTDSDTDTDSESHLPTVELGPTSDYVFGGIREQPVGASRGYAWDPADVSIETVLLAPDLADVDPHLQCRWGKVDEEGRLADDLAWFPCPESPFTPEHDLTVTGDGAYQTQVRVAAGGSVSPEPIAYPYYLHQSLSGAQDCTLRAEPEAYFDRARILLGTSVTGAFVTDGEAEDPGYVQLSNPFVRVNFSLPVRRSLGFRIDGGTFAPSRPDMISGEVEVLSLRRRFLLSEDGRHLLIYRRYASRRANGDCTGMSVARRMGTRSIMRACEAVVIDRDGVGVCLTTDDVGDVRAVAGWQPGDWTVGAWFHGFSTAALPPDEPLRVNRDNAMWRDLLSRHGTTQGGRNFSPKCYQSDTCADGRVAHGATGPIPWLYLPDADLYRF